MSNVGRWDHAYADVDVSQPYGDSPSYRIGAEHLAGCERIEDWGCGLGWFRHFVNPDAYVGIDGSHSKFADVVDDLEERRSQTAGLFMRHVLEHNYKWPLILDNAVASFTERMVLVIFTPWSDRDTSTYELRFEVDYGVPTLSLRRESVLERLEPFTVTEVKIESPTTFYGIEHILLVTR